jgi:hypothetical protein
MDLSENGKCLFTSLQYVESSHAPYQRIRFFFIVFRAKWALLKSFFEQKSVGACVSIVQSGVLDPWPEIPGFGP